MNISFGNMGNLVSGVVASLPSTLGNDAASMTALGDALKGVTADHLVANGFPDDLAERLESLAAAGNAGNATDAGNADVWDAYVSYMAEHPDEQAQTVAELDVVVGEMAQQPAAEEQALEQITGAAAEPGTGGGLRDLLGSEVLRNLTDKIDGITQNIANAVESAGSLTTESLQGVLTESIGAADQAGVENATQRMQEMMDSMDSLLDELMTLEPESDD